MSKKYGRGKGFRSVNSCLNCQHSDDKSYDNDLELYCCKDGTDIPDYPPDDCSSDVFDRLWKKLQNWKDKREVSATDICDSWEGRKR